MTLHAPQQQLRDRSLRQRNLIQHFAGELNHEQQQISGELNHKQQQTARELNHKPHQIADELNLEIQSRTIRFFTTVQYSQQPETEIGITSSQI
jgi:hypothetical protein